MIHFNLGFIEQSLKADEDGDYDVKAKQKQESFTLAGCMTSVTSRSLLKRKFSSIIINHLLTMYSAHINV